MGRAATAVLLCLLCGIPPASAPASDDRAAERPDEVVLLAGGAKGEGAPSARGVKDLVVLTEVEEADPWFEAVVALGLEDVKEVIPFRPGKLDAAFKRLAGSRPGFVVVLVRPGTLDVNFHFELLERASRLDDDPFVDFAFGYLTGADPGEAKAFAAGIAAARGRELPRRVLEFGPSASPAPLTLPAAHAWAPGIQELRLAHPENAPGIPEALAAAGPLGILRAWGHGMPDRVVDGLTGSALRASTLDLAGALYFSGPCYCGVTGTWYDTGRGGVRKAAVDPGESFLLSLLRARAGAVFAGLDPDRGESSEQEVEHLLGTGDPLGLVAKSTWDDVVLAYRRDALALPRYADGKGRPFRDIHDQMISGAACRALFGDPTWAPFPASGEEFFRVAVEKAKAGYQVTWRHDGDLSGRWAPVDVLRAEGGWTQRIRFRCDLPEGEGRRLRRFTVEAVEKDGKPLQYLYPTAAVESWGGRLRLHGMVVFPRRQDGGALSGARSLEARFLFRE